MKTGTPWRLTWVGSFVHFDHSFEKKPTCKDQGVLEHVDDERQFVAMPTYANPKLLVTMFVEELAGHVDPSKVIASNVSPGTVKTMFGEYPAWLRIVLRALFVLFALRARNVDEGAMAYLHALGVAGEESHGKYLSDNLVTE